MTPPESADAATAALGRLADLHLCDADDYRNPPEFCVEDAQDWPCDTAIVLGLARRFRDAEAALRAIRIMATAYSSDRDATLKRIVGVVNLAFERVALSAAAPDAAHEDAQEADDGFSQ